MCLVFLAIKDSVDNPSPKKELRKVLKKLREWNNKYNEKSKIEILIDGDSIWCQNQFYDPKSTYHLVMSYEDKHWKRYEYYIKQRVVKK
jgi:hypothetical protein